MPTSPIPASVLWHLRAGDGYMDLNMWPQAQAELDAVPEAYRTTPEYLAQRYRLCAGCQRWAEAAETARALRARTDTQPEAWIMLAYAVRRAETIEAARAILLQALDRFPACAIIPFNLACYACRSGQLAEAHAYLDRAFKLDAQCRTMALADEDLEPLWPALRDTADL